MQKTPDQATRILQRFAACMKKRAAARLAADYIGVGLTMEQVKNKR
jgi:hypothetical protein